MGKIIIAPHRDITDGQLVYLAGPMFQTLDWHGDAISHLSINPRVDIALPQWATEKGEPTTDNEKKEHQAWQEDLLERATKRGVVMFWFPFTSEIPISQSQPYFLLSFIAEVFRQKPFRLIVGIEEGNPEYEYIVAELDSYAIPVCTSLEDACEEVLRLLR